MKPSLCLNMIVKNEAARIARCLNSVLPYVKSVVVLDTGSTDGTPDIIEKMCRADSIPCVVEGGRFENFSQARNDAFSLAQKVNDDKSLDMPFCQFALLMDADMELVADNPGAFSKLDARHLSFDMMQKGGTISYANRRILNLTHVNDHPYMGVTHEYIDVPAQGMITDARFVDHADGANRVEKYPRDAALLEEALKTEPQNGRYWYYLAQTYRDWGKPKEAASAYGQRIHLGGWDEETHAAMMGLAFALKDQGPKSGDGDDEFVSQLITSYNFRPRRAEPLYELAKYYREKGDNAAALLFAKAGINIKRPDDLLFVNDYVYEHGLRYEYSIAGFYDEAERPSAFTVTNARALDPTCPHDQRWSSRNNLYHFTQPLNALCPSFRASRVPFTPEAGWTAMNPSIEVCNGSIKVNVRCVNYKIDERGRYMIGPLECNDAPIETRNFICSLTETFHLVKAREIVWNHPAPAWNMVVGLEDVRLHRYKGEQHFTAAVRELSPSGYCQQVTGKLSFAMDDSHMKVEEWKVLSRDGEYQKNWMPIEHLPNYFYRCDVVIDQDGNTKKFPTKLHVGDISGSSQAIEFKCGYLAVVHEAITGPDGQRTYWHRFAWWNKDFELRRLSVPFVFHARQIEFCAGLAVHPDPNKLILSYGIKDAEAWLATVSAEEVAMLLGPFHEN